METIRVGVSMEIFHHDIIPECPWPSGGSIDYVTGIGNVIQAPPHSLLRANTFSVGQQATNF